MFSFIGLLWLLRKRHRLNYEVPQRIFFALTQSLRASQKTQKATYFGEFCYLCRSCIRKSITVLWAPHAFVENLANRSLRPHVGAKPGCVGISMASPYKSRNIPLTWILGMVFAYLPPFIYQILHFIYWTVLILILIYLLCMWIYYY